MGSVDSGLGTRKNYTNYRQWCVPYDSCDKQALSPTNTCKSPIHMSSLWVSKYTYIYIYTHTHTHIYIYTYINTDSFRSFSLSLPPTPPSYLTLSLWARASLFTRFLDHTQRRTTFGRTPLDEWSARRRDLYLTTHNTHNGHTSMLPVGFKPTISAGEQSQTYALDRAATGDRPFKS